MKYYKIPKGVRIDIEQVVKRYPENKRELETIYEDVILATHHAGMGETGESDNRLQSVTESKALKLTGPYYERIKREVIAVENAMNGLSDAKRDIIRKRFWSNNCKTAYKSIDVPYEQNTMRFITKKVLFEVGVNMGLIERKK